MGNGYRKNKLFFLVLIATAGVIFQIVRVQSNNSSQIVLKSEIVEVMILQEQEDAGKAVGSGVILKQDEKGMWIVTAAHVLETKSENDKVLVNFRGQDNEVSLRCEKYWLSENADLAFLFFPQSQAKRIVGQPVQRAPKEVYDSLELDTYVYAKGIRAGKEAACSGHLIDNWIYVEDLEQYMMTASCDLYPGMSGGGLYDVEDTLVGILCGNGENEILVAVPLHVMEAEWERILGKF